MLLADKEGRQVAPIIRRQHLSQDLHGTDRQPVQKDSELERITIRHITSETDNVRGDITYIPPGRTAGERWLAGRSPPSLFSDYKQKTLPPGLRIRFLTLLLYTHTYPQRLLILTPDRGHKKNPHHLLLVASHRCCSFCRTSF